MYKLKKYLKKFIIILMLPIILINMLGCKKKEEEEAEEKKVKLRVAMDVRDKYTTNIIKFLISEFEKAHENIEITYGNTLEINNNTLQEIYNGMETDIILTSRNNMIELYKKGFINELSGVYKDNNLHERFYDISNAYGRIKENYYGISLIPYSVEFLYNKKALQRMKIGYPKNIKQWGEILKYVKREQDRIPVVLTEDLDTNLGLMSLLMSNNVNINELGRRYNSSMEEYSRIEGVQKTFNVINKLVKENYFDDTTFEMGGENSINRFISGEIPVMVCMSYFSNRFNEREVGTIEDYSIGETYRSNIPVIVNCMLCTAVTNKNKEETNKLIKFILSDETQNKLAKLGHITGNKYANRDFASLNRKIVQHLYNANDNSIIFVYNIPGVLYDKFAILSQDLLNGKYRGDEWTRIIQTLY